MANLPLERPFAYDYTTKTCDKVVKKITDDFEHEHGKSKKKPKIFIGKYVDSRLGRVKHQTTHREQVQAALDKFWDQVNWSDASGSDGKAIRPWTLPNRVSN